MSNDLTLKCSYCEARVDDASDWIEIQIKGDHDGCICCEDCQHEAAWYFGQMRDNIRHTRMLPRLIIQWSEE